MKRIFYILAFIFFGLFGVVNEGWSTTIIYKNEGSIGTVDGITATGNVNTTSSNGNPGNSLANTSSSNTTFTFIGFNVSNYENLELSIDAKFASFPSTTNTWPYTAVTFYKNNIVVKIDNTIIKWTTKGNAYSTYTISNIPDFDKIIIVCYPASGKSGAGNATTNYATYMDNITLTGEENTTTTYDTITFRDIHNNKWTQKTTENNDTIFFYDTVPSEACRLNGWVFAGWSTDSLDETKIIKDSSYIIPTKNDTLYAFYKIISNESITYITDTLTYNKIGLGYHDAHYTDFSDVKFNSGSEYCGNIWRLPGTYDTAGKRYIQMRASDNSGIVLTKSAGKLANIKVVWNNETTNGRTLKIYCSDTVYSTNNLYNYARCLDSITYGVSNSISLDGSMFIGMRSKTGSLMLDTIYITWAKNGFGYEYSTNPQCFGDENTIRVAEWFEDKVEFDIGNYDSVHIYRDDLTSKSCDSIRIKITNDNNEECIRWFKVPIFGGANTIIDNLDCDIVILKDSTLTINSNISNNNVYVYPDGILHIKENKTYTVNSLTLRRDNNDVPQFLYKGTLKVNDGMFFEMRTDAEDWRWLTLPDSIRISEISDKPEVLLKYYDGNERAKNGRGGWKILNKDSISGFGTIFGINIDTDEKRIYKFRLDTNILSQEKSLANKHIKVKKFFYSNKPTNDLGWNLVGNPFMTTYNVNTLFGVIFESDSLVKEIVNGQWTGRWITKEKDLRYIVVPSDKQEQHIIEAGGYEQICLQDGYKLPPFTSFFVQAKDGGDLVFYHGQREANALSRKTIINENKESFLRICIGSIKTGCYISNKFNDTYEIGDDMESLYSTYQLINDYKLLYSAVNDSIIEHGIKVYASSGNLHLDDKTNVEDFNEIYALYNGDWIDLLHGQTQDVNGEFMLFAKRKNKENITTDIDIIKNDNIVKFIQNNNLYIKKNNHVYNILGGVVK